MRLKVVIDTNVSISGILWDGTPNKILKLARDGFIEICSTKTICEEFIRVLEYTRIKKRIEKLKITKEKIIDYYEDIVGLYKEISYVDIIKEDDTDNRFLEAALDSGCKIVISGDGHLYKLKKYKDILILTPKEFIEVYKQLKV